MRLVYSVVVNSDRTEGRGFSRHIALFTRQADAESFARGRDVQGQDGTELTKEERVLLGLEDL